MTMEEAAEMRKEWIATFPEMQKHMNPLKAKSIKTAARAYGMERHAEDDEEEDDNGSRDYMAILPCGQIRNRCSYNAACNTQSTFEAVYKWGELLEAQKWVISSQAMEDHNST